MDKQSAPQRKYHPPYEDECPAQPMSAPRTNAAIADEMEKYDHSMSPPLPRQLLREAAAALRKEPPALPAEVEAVLMQMKIASGRLYGKTVDVMEEAATLLRRYAQAVAEKDGAKCPCDVHACLATVAEKDAEIPILREAVHYNAQANREAHKKLQAVEAHLCGPDDGCVCCRELRKILREEH